MTELSENQKKLMEAMGANQDRKVESLQDQLMNIVGEHGEIKKLLAECGLAGIPMVEGVAMVVASAKREKELDAERSEVIRHLNRLKYPTSATFADRVEMMAAGAELASKFEGDNKKKAEEIRQLLEENAELISKLNLQRLIDNRQMSQDIRETPKELCERIEALTEALTGLFERHPDWQFSATWASDFAIKHVLKR